MTLSYASAFAGIGGFDLGFDLAGLGQATIQIEINPHSTTILNRHFPNVPKAGDIRDCTGADLGDIDLAICGFPCTGTSVGQVNRTGLDHDESRNYWEFHRCLGEAVRLLGETRPRWVVIENPVGLLTSPGIGKDDGVDRRGWDMAAVVRSLEDLGYGWAYRVVDARHVGSAQRRQRVLLVGHLGGDPRPAWKVLGDTGAGDEAVAASPVGPPRRSPTAVGPAGGSEPLIFRKSARARASIAKGGYETWRNDDYANTLTGFDFGGPARQTHLVVTETGVRTLTLTEWERLSGFPDDWTTGIPDGARGEALGACMNVDLAHWLGRRLLAVDSSLPLIGAR